MRSQVLNALKQGIVRLRSKGGADPSTLYDLLNGYVAIDGSIKSRPGTKAYAQLPYNATKGLCAFDGGLVVFSAQAGYGGDTGYTIVALLHPTDATLDLREIHFAAPFLGKLYVVAEFTNGDVFHYWLLNPKPWKPNTVYGLTDSVQPTVPNGLYYRIGNTEFPQAWQPGTNYQIGDVVVPTTMNGWKYTCIDAVGDTPSSGKVEPVWPEADGATVTEEHDASSGTTPGPTTPPPNPGGDRYSNPGGGGSSVIKAAGTSAV